MMASSVPSVSQYEQRVKLVAETLAAHTELNVTRSTGMITVLGSVVLMVIVAIGALDGRSGLGLFASYRSASVTGVGRRSARWHTRHSNRPKPPTSAS
jgi:hypothetical protein